MKKAAKKMLLATIIFIVTVTAAYAHTPTRQNLLRKTFNDDCFKAYVACFQMAYSRNN